MAKIKVYGGWGFFKGGQMRCVVATTSKAKVREITGLNPSYVRDYWGETRNEAEVKAALKHVGKVLVKPDPYADVFELKE